MRLVVQLNREYSILRLPLTYHCVCMCVYMCLVSLDADIVSLTVLDIPVAGSHNKG